MRESIDCETARRRLEAGDFDDGGLTAHISECGGCREISLKERRLSKLLGSLPKADAPPNFDRRITSAIAESSGRSSRNPFAAWAPVLIPVIGVLLIGFFLIRGFLVSPDQNSTAVNEPPERGSVEETGSPANIGVSPSTVESGEEIVREDTGAPPANNVNSSLAQRRTDTGDRESQAVERTTAPSVDKPGGRSLDSATRPGRTINPPGLDPTRPIDNPEASRTEREFSAVEILSELGIVSAERSSEWVVDSVNAGSIAERAGVKEGDVLLALDGKTIGADVRFAGSVSGKELKVRRNGDQIVIRFTPVN